MKTVTDDETAPPAPAEIVWIGGHPTVADPMMRGTRIRRCLICDARQDFAPRACAGGRGMIVHLIDPADIHAHPEVFDGSPFAEPDAIAAAHAHWSDKGFTVARKPGPPGDESEHPRFVPCPVCNRLALRLLSMNMPAAAHFPAGAGRGEQGRDATRR